MPKDLIVKRSVHLNATPEAVWDALTNPQIAKKYFLGCEAISDWRVGSPLAFKTNYGGQEITPVKGVVTEVEHPVKLSHTCYASEKETVPSEHTKATYLLKPVADGTELTVTQGPFHDQETFDKTCGSWDLVLAGLQRTLAE